LPADAPPLEASPARLANRWWRLELEAATGALKSLYDKERGLELLAGAAAQLLVVHDPTDTWGHGLTSLRHLLGVFEPRGCELVESGPVRATLRLEYRYRGSWARQHLHLYRHSPRLEGELWVNWQEQHQALQLAFPFALSGAEATFEVPYGHAVRPADGQEEPVQRWLNVSGSVRDARGVAQRAGVALLNDGKYSASVLGGEARLTLLRSPVFGHHDPARLEPGVRYAYQDQGLQSLRWALLPHAGDWRAAGVTRHAQDFNSPLPFVREYVHAGEAPPRHSFVRLEDPQALHLTALKRAEDGEGLVLRLFEPHGRAARTRLEAFGQAFTVEAGPHQIKTYRLSPAGLQEANLLEE
ncbi:glycoside hydrolase family 38 C-terminal domain-containing protein, partial [Calidithermus terrae]|uniref:glycoside hydrolase family 38 C-terminal domain-containing protein n=1 Tax=Calidithermus terrae TaxID=1408545 RepID=UPI001FE26A4B